MRRLLSTPLLFVLAAWTHGQALVSASATCNGTTGLFTGVGGPGTCMTTPATCNGVADDTNAFVSFRSWALTWQAAHPGLLYELIGLPSTCYLIAGLGGGGSTGYVFDGLTPIRVNSPGTTFTTNNNPSAAGINFGTQGLCSKGLTDAAGCSARIQTVSAGASTVCLTAASAAAGYISRFTAGGTGTMAGIDLQGAGQPFNPGVFEIVEFLSVDTVNKCVTFTTPLINEYRSNWPLYNSGSALEPDLGGPATLYAFPSSWNVTQEFIGLTINQPLYQTLSRGRAITFRNTTVLGSAGLIPSQNQTWACLTCTMAAEGMEVDKLIGSVTISDTTIRKIDIQSSSVQNMTLTNVTITESMDGSPRDLLTITNSSIADFRPGVTRYGISGALKCNGTCTFPIFSVGGGVTLDNMDTWFSMSGGIINVPPTLSVSGAADNGAGKVRLTVTSSAGQIEGKNLQISGISGTTEANGIHAISIVDATHIDLPTVPFVNAYTGASNPVAGKTPILWAVPRGNICWTSSDPYQPPCFQVTDLDQDSNNATRIYTTMAGGFPTPPSGTRLDVHAVAVPKMDCTGCTGSILAIDLANSGAQNIPMFQWPSRTVVGAATTANFPAWGTLQSITITVNTPYAGAGALTFSMGGPFVIGTDGHTRSAYNPIVNAKVAGTRVITPSTVTGAQSGDTLGVAPGAIWMLSDQITPGYSSIPGDIGSTSVTITIKTDQGVVYP